MGKQNHILFISSWYPSRNKPTHGIFNQQFAEAVATKYDVSVIYVSSEEEARSKFELSETLIGEILIIHVYYKKVTSRIPIFSQALKFFRFLKAYGMAFAHLLLKRRMPDLMQLNVVMPAGLAVFYLSKKYKLPYVVNEGWTGYMPEDGSYKGFFQKTITKCILAKAKKIMPVSEGLKEAMLTQGLQGDYEVVPNVVDTEIFKPTLRGQKNETHFIHISTLDPAQKNVAGIIQAFHLALKQTPDLYLNIIGDGEEKPRLQELVKNLELNHKINFKGNLDSMALAKEFSDCDALIMFSNYESFCVVIAEAFACGKPVITSKAGGLTDQISPDFGLLVEKRNILQLTEAIVQFVKNKKTYEGQSLHNYVSSNFSKNVIGHKLGAIYEELLSEKNA